MITTFNEHLVCNLTYDLIKDTKVYFSSRWQYNQKSDKGVNCSSGMDVVSLFFIPK